MSFNYLFYDYYALTFIILYFTFTVQHTISVRSNAPEDGQNCCPKHVELIWIYQWTVSVASSCLSSLPHRNIVYLVHYCIKNNTTLSANTIINKLIQLCVPWLTQPISIKRSNLLDLGVCSWMYVTGCLFSIMWSTFWLGYCNISPSYLTQYPPIQVQAARSFCQGRVTRMMLTIQYT